MRETHPLRVCPVALADQKDVLSGGDVGVDVTPALLDLGPRHVARSPGGAHVLDHVTVDVRGVTGGVIRVDPHGAAPGTGFDGLEESDPGGVPLLVGSALAAGPVGVRLAAARPVSGRPHIVEEQAVQVVVRPETPDFRQDVCPPSRRSRVHEEVFGSPHVSIDALTRTVVEKPGFVRVNQLAELVHSRCPGTRPACEALRATSRSSGRAHRKGHVYVLQDWLRPARVPDLGNKTILPVVPGKDHLGVTRYERLGSRPVSRAVVEPREARRAGRWGCDAVRHRPCEQQRHRGKEKHE
jgi:hypothetical protein